MPKIMAETVGIGNWVTILSTALIFGFLVTIIVKLNNMFTGKILIEYSKQIVGKPVSYFLAIYYTLYFIAIIIFLMTSVSTIIEANILIKTPKLVTLIATLSICGYGAYKGITSVARLFEIYGLLFFLSIIVFHTIMLFQGKMDNLRPFYNPVDTSRYFLGIKDTIFPFLGIEILTVIPFSKQNKKRSTRVAFLTLIAIGFIYVFVVQTSIMMIGINEIVHYEDALITALRQIQLPQLDFLRRLDVIFIVIALMGMISGIMIVFTAIVEYLVKIFSRINRVLIIIGIGILIFGLSLIALNIKDFQKTFPKIIIYFGLVAAGVIPITLYSIAKVKKYVKIYQKNISKE